MNKIWLYYFDVFLVRVRKTIKALLPTFFTSRISKQKFNREKALALTQIFAEPLFPWSSPNIWMEIVDFYHKKDKPVITEFGIGTSTICHLIELMQMNGGVYIGIENDRTWFWSVVASVLNKASRLNEKVSIRVTPSLINPQENTDAEILVGNVTVLLRLRTISEDYINALDEPCDVIVVDGVNRTKCVKKILGSRHLKRGVMLMLMEAGRGSMNWWEGKLVGDMDYSTELQTLLFMGGTLLDGNGLDNWPGCKKRSPKPVSYYYPMEACKLIIS